MKELLKKEFALCLHPTSIIFLAFCLFVFIPNYPYEIMFFFSGLSVFFICLTARENGDIRFSCALPIKKSQVALARIITVVILQAALLLLAGVTVTIKQLTFTAEQQVNMAGNMANVAILGYGIILLGVFNIIFFPMHYKKPQNVGIPFVIASAAVFVLIALLITLRFAAPLFANVLNTPDPANISAKLIAFGAGLLIYIGCTVGSCVLSMRLFDKVDL